MRARSSVFFFFFFFKGYVCCLVMQFSALHDSHRATHSLFFFFCHIAPQAMKVCSIVIYLLPVREDSSQC